MTRMQPPVEPMKRKRVILTTVQLMAVAAVVAPTWRGIWRAVAYVGRTDDSGFASSAFH